MIVKHLQSTPEIHATTFVAPNVVVCGAVSIGKNCRIMYGATIIAEGGTIQIGDNVVIFENAVIRSTPTNSTKIGSNILIGPTAHVVGCTIEDEVFVATHSAIFHGAHLERGSEVRVGGVVHANSRLSKNDMVPIHWVAVGDPAKVFPPDQHDYIWEVQKTLNFNRTVYGVETEDGKPTMPEIIKMTTSYLGKHIDDEVIE